MKIIFDLRDFTIKKITTAKLSFLAPELYREVKIYDEIDSEIETLHVERYYEVFYGDNMELKITYRLGEYSQSLNELCDSYINTMVMRWQVGTEYEQLGCRLLKEIWVIPSVDYKIPRDKLGLLLERL